MAGPCAAAEPPSGGTHVPRQGSAKIYQRWHGPAALSSCPKKLSGRFSIRVHRRPGMPSAVATGGATWCPDPKTGAEFLTRAHVRAMRPRGAMVQARGCMHSHSPLQAKPLRCPRQSTTSSPSNGENPSIPEESRGLVGDLSVDGGRGLHRLGSHDCRTVVGWRFADVTLLLWLYC